MVGILTEEVEGVGYWEGMGVGDTKRVGVAVGEAEGREIG